MNERECVENCSLSYYAENQICKKCMENCLACQQLNRCQQCNSYSELTENFTCNVTSYPYCHYSCYQCSGPLSSNCLTCNGYRTLVEGYCECLEGEIDKGETVCSKMPLMQVIATKAGNLITGSIAVAALSLGGVLPSTMQGLQTSQMMSYLQY